MRAKTILLETGETIADLADTAESLHVEASGQSNTLEEIKATLEEANALEAEANRRLIAAFDEMSNAFATLVEAIRNDQ